MTARHFAPRKLRHLGRRPPRGHLGFAWGRFPHYRPPYPGEPTSEPESVQYRLFLRDSTGRTFMEARTFDAYAPRDGIAKVLRGMRAQLRWCVDQVEFARLGLQDTAPQPATGE